MGFIDPGRQEPAKGKGPGDILCLRYPGGRAKRATSPMESK